MTLDSRIASYGSLIYVDSPAVSELRQVFEQAVRDERETIVKQIEPVSRSSVCSCGFVKNLESCLEHIRERGKKK